MFNNILSQLPQLMKDTEPDLKKLIGDQLKSSGVQLPNAVIVKNIQVKLDSSFVAGQALTSLQGQILLNFKDKFLVNIKGDQNITLKVDKVVSLTLCKEGFSSIQGINIDGPGPINPSLKSILIEGKELVIKVGPITQRLPLPPEFTAFL